MKVITQLLAAFFVTACSAGAAADPASSAYYWQSVTVGGGGFAPEIVFSPVEKGLVYLRTDMGGAYRWDAKLRHWSPLQDGFDEGSYLGIEALAPDPKNPNVVYVAAGMYYSQPAAILRSADRGKTWTITPVPFKMGGNEDGRGLGERLAIDPNHTSSLLFGSRHDGLWQSGDSGKSWHKVGSFPWKGLGAPKSWRSHGGVSFVIYDPHSNAVFAAVADPTAQHLYRSLDSGRTWTAIAGGPPQTLLPVKAAIDANGILYIDYCNGIGPNGITKGAVWKLDTRKNVWTDITPDSATYGGYMGLSLDPTHPGRLAVSTVDREPRDTVWLSSDGGRTWASLRERSRLDVSATPFLNFDRSQADFGHWLAGLAFDPFGGGTLAYTTGATVMRTLDFGAVSPLWKPWVDGIEQTAVITFTSPTGGAPVISGFGDIAGFVHDRLDVSPPHMHLNPFLPNTNNLDYAGRAPEVVVRSSSNYQPQPNAVSLAWSSDGGHNWNPLKAPPVQTQGGALQRFDTNGEAPITVTADGKTFFVSGPTSLATSDRGTHWWRPSGVPQNARVIADKFDPTLLYAIDFTSSRILVSKDGGHAFAPVAGIGLPKDFSAERPNSREAQFPLQATPGKRGELWFLLRGQLYCSRDAGQAFALRTSATLSIKLFGLGAPAPGANVPAIYTFAKIDGIPALWRSIDGGTSWQRINDDAHQWGLRFRAIGGDPKQYGRVYLATDGRGILFGDPLR